MHSFPTRRSSDLTEVVKIEEESVLIRTPEGEKSIPNDYVLAMTGYLPDFEFLDKIGVDRNPDDAGIPFTNPDTLETNIPGLFLAGVIDRKSTRLNSSHVAISYAVFCLKKK